MLEHIFGSKTRLKLLQIFLSHPENSYYVRELTRVAKMQINAIRRELDNLEKLNIISSHKEEPRKGKTKKRSLQEKKYFRVNIDHILYQELKALVLKAQLLLEYDLAKKITRMGAVKYLALTGIFVGFIGAPTDLFIVGSIKKEKLVQLIRKFEKELNYEINFTLMSPSEFRYRRDITDRFLYSILENKKVVVLDNL